VTQPLNLSRENLVSRICLQIHTCTATTRHPAIRTNVTRPALLLRNRPAPATVGLYSLNAFDP
jgi:hypothetical protein